jgi:glycosyltransferase involved in cell wall biosynthesis
VISIAIALPNYLDGKLGGTQTFVDELIPRIATNQDFEVTVYCQKGQSMNGLSNCSVENVFMSASSKLTSLLSIMQVGMPKIRRRLKSHDLVYFPLQSSFRISSIGTLSLATIHDVQHLDLPHLFSKLERLYRLFAYDRQAAKFSHIATDSEFSRERIIHHLKIDNRKIDSILIGTRVIFNTSLEPRQDFLLFPARSWPHKNHSNLFEAIRLMKRNGRTVRLILTGEPPDVPNDLLDSIENLGRIDQATLDNLYCTARALVFPSLYEGFGLPPIEAMSAGCPVYVSNAGSLPEVCGDAAIYFDPLSVESIHDAILKSEVFDAERIEKGKIRASGLNWDSTAEKYGDLIRHMVNEKYNF